MGELRNPDDLRSLHGELCLVTGGTQGVGRGIALEFARRGAETVVIVGRDERRGAAVVAEVHRCGSDARFIPGALENDGDCQRALQTIDEQYGRIDVLVNAAGSTERSTLRSVTAESFDYAFALNVRAPLLLMRDAVALMISRGTQGRIVNVSSIVASGGPAYLCTYSATKAALEALTRNVAHSVMRYGIRVNAVAPGEVDTPNQHLVRTEYHGAADDWLEAEALGQPFGRVIQPSELARVVAFLATAESGLMTGEVVHYAQAVPGAGELRPPTWAETLSGQ